MVGALNKLPVAASGMMFFGDAVTFPGVLAIFLGFVAGLVYAAGMSSSSTMLIGTNTLVHSQPSQRSRQRKPVRPNLSLLPLRINPDDRPCNSHRSRTRSLVPSTTHLSILSDRPLVTYELECLFIVGCSFRTLCKAHFLRTAVRVGGLVRYQRDLARLVQIREELDLVTSLSFSPTTSSTSLPLPTARTIAESP